MLQNPKFQYFTRKCITNSLVFTCESIDIEEQTKTHTDRFVYLIPEAIEILDKLPHEGEFIFMRNGSRLTSRQINYVLEKNAERNGLKTKSSHKMRKTYASMCSAKGVPMDFIREQLGHASLSTTYGYIYNPLTEKETYETHTRALSSGKSPGPYDTDTGNVVDFTSKLYENDLSPFVAKISRKIKERKHR